MMHEKQKIFQKTLVTLFVRHVRRITLMEIRQECQEMGSFAIDATLPDGVTAHSGWPPSYTPSAALIAEFSEKVENGPTARHVFRSIAAMSESERRALIDMMGGAPWCRACGSNNPGCRCWDDE